MADEDSPLSIAANVAGILTFVVAILAAIYVRITYLRNSDDEYFRVKASLSWYKTESTWLAELVKTTQPADGRPPSLRPSPTPQQYQPEYQMFSFVMDDLVKLEKRLLELVADTEERAAAAQNGNLKDGHWTLVPRSWSFSTNVAVAWLPVRTKALELVRQRDALTARVQFTQMSMISSRIRDLESRAKWQEKKTEDSLARLETLVAEQRTEIHRLEDLVYRLMHRNRVSQIMDHSLADAIKLRRSSVGSQQSNGPASPVTPTSPTGATPPRNGHDRRPSTGSIFKRRSRSK